MLAAQNFFAAFLQRNPGPEEAHILGTAILIAVSALCMLIAQRMAISRRRSTGCWILAAAFLGPLPLVVLAFIPAEHAKNS